LRRIPDRPPLADVLKALSDPIRWSIVVQLAATDDLAATALEHTLPISKTSISYHVKALAHARLLTVRKEGRYYFYQLRRDVLDDALDRMTKELSPPAVHGAQSSAN
jgi:DNA-binding transcriptional ArsR family regulator